MKNKKVLGAIGFAVVAGFAIFFIYRDINKEVPEGTIEVVDNTFDTSGVTTIAIGEPNPSAPKAPELIRSTNFPNTLTPEVKTTVLAHLDTTIKEIEKDGNFQSWLMLGVYRKTLGDYEGARIVWDYTKTIAPNEVVSYNNLADLYHYYLKDFKKSEENWKKAIAVKGDYILAYSGLVDLYKYSMTEKKGEIPTVLKDGIAKNPDALDLVVMLAHYYQDVGDTTGAKKAYSDAIAIAERLGNTDAVTRLKSELGSIK